MSWKNQILVQGVKILTLMNHTPPPVYVMMSCHDSSHFSGEKTEGEGEGAGGEGGADKDKAGGPGAAGGGGGAGGKYVPPGARSAGGGPRGGESMPERKRGKQRHKRNHLSTF